MSVEPIRAAALDGVAHGFFGRRGGVSAGEVAGLNAGLGADDDPAAVAENRRRIVAAVLPGGPLVTPYQVHSADTVTVMTPFADGLRPQADAVVTDRPGLLLGIVTADCAPVLLADRDAGVVGAVHAGWRGALDGVTDSAIVAMEALGVRRDRIAAAVGPCIARGSYEVDRAFFHRFVADQPANERFFADGRPEHFQFDLEGYVVARLAEAGVGRIAAMGLDTYGDAQRFFSFRRATHRGEGSYGRQLSVIGLRE